MESANTLIVSDECDVLVVGGGSAGHSAAIAAARAGCEKVVILERYGYFGGDVTGGYVLMIPALSWHKYSMVRGIQEEWFTRLDKSAPESYITPSLQEIGEKSPIKLDRWSLIHGCVTPSTASEQYLVRAPYYDPNQLKIEMDLMIQEEPNIKVLLHCWGTKPIMENNTIKGVIYESKEGRKAIMAKIVIDATGDGDIYSQAGAPCFMHSEQKTRGNKTALVWRMGGVDFENFARWAKDHPAEAASFNQEMAKVAGYPTMFFPTDRNDVVWFNNWLPELNCIDLEDIKYTEYTVRNSIRKLRKFCRENMPATLRNAYLFDIAPQLGSRCSRRLDGEYILSRLDFATASKFDDVIAWHSVVGMVNEGAPVELPYRAILPKKIENLLCPARHLSADEVTIDGVSLIPQCVGTGQAAGVAAAVCVKEGTTTHNVNIGRVQKILCTQQDVPLPRQENTDPELIRELEEYKYGTMTPTAKKIRAEAGLDW
ncbi:MAG: FAD-dependent oxidoreductase [Clostridiales bacterium]|nr:FAD-dependent oxidoreductase [Clostridiales bacterium]